MHPHLPQGIRVEEGTTQSQAIQAVEIRPTAFVGASQRGPLNAPTLVRSFTEFCRVFGKPTLKHPLPYAVRLYFTNGGEQALIVRVAHGARAACIDLPGEEGALRLWSRNAGEHDYLRAAVDYDAIDPLDIDCFNLTLQRLAEPGTEHVVDQEIYHNVSTAPSHPNFAPQLLAGSHLVRVGDRVPSMRPDITLNHTTGRPQYFRGLSETGSEGARITMADVLGSSDERTGLFALTEQYDLGQLYIPPLDFSTDVAAPVLRAAARLCDRRHALLIADAPRQWGSSSAAVEQVDRFSLRGPNIALYYPWLEHSERIDGADSHRVPPGGAVAGALERTTREHGPSAMPAGNRVRLKGFRRFADTVNDGASYALSSRGVNTLRTAKGGRKVIWDAVLLNKRDDHCDSSYDVDASLRVRRLLQFVAKSVEHGLKWTAFEDHSEHLWRRVQSQVTDFLAECLRRGWLAGTTADNAYRVHCDLNTNPGSLRQNGELGISIELAPLVPSRFVKLNVVVPTAGNAHFG